MILPFVAAVLCSILAVQASCPSSIQPGEAVDLNIECSLNGAKVVWKSSGGVDVINLDYNCLSINSNTSKTAQKSTLLDWSQQISGERSVNTGVEINSPYQCTVSGCYEDDLFYDRYKIPEQKCSFIPTTPTSIPLLASPSSPSPSPSSPSSSSPSSPSSSSPSSPSSSSPSSPSPSPSSTTPSTTLSSTSPLLSSALSAKPLPTMHPNNDDEDGFSETSPAPHDPEYCPCANALSARTKSTNKPCTDYWTAFISVLTALAVIILLQFIIICVLCIRVKFLTRKPDVTKPVTI